MVRRPTAASVRAHLDTRLNVISRLATSARIFDSDRPMTSAASPGVMSIGATVRA